MSKQLSKLGQDLKERLWQVELGEGCYRVVHGIVGRPPTFRVWKHVEGVTARQKKKNLQVEVDRLYTAKLAEGYTETIEAHPRKPMLPRPWVAPDAAELAELEKQPEPVLTVDSRYPVAIQPRMEGVIGMLDGAGVRGKNGKIISSCEGFAKAFESLRMPGLLALDGVVYNHAYKDRISTLNGIIARPGNRLKELQFFVFDGVFEDDELTFRTRYKLLFDPKVGIISKLSIAHPNVRAAPTYVVRNRTEDEQAFQMCLTSGYSGMLYRPLLAWYTPGLTRNLRERLRKS